VALIILPIFALANTAIVLSGDIGQSLSQSHSIGIILGLVVGKPLGIFLMAYLAVRFGLCALPSDLNWKAIFGAGLLGGIGFTMSIFITLLAFDNAAMINDAKLSILLASFFSGTLGFVVLHKLFRRPV
jgi:NhaA family Na+:H+ antiporter